MGFVAKTSLNIISKVAEDLDKEGAARVMRAARYVRGQIVSSAKTNVKHKITGNLYKGVAAQGRGEQVHFYTHRLGLDSKMHRTKTKAYAIVGMTAPAYHAHLLEFGVKPHTQTNAFGKGVITQHPGAKAQPFFMKAIEASKGAVEQILSEPWVR